MVCVFVAMTHLITIDPCQSSLQLHYDEKEAAKYTRGSRNTKIQVQLTHRALELLNLPAGDPAFLLDVGCGSGLSGGEEFCSTLPAGLPCHSHMLPLFVLNRGHFRRRLHLGWA